MTQKKLSTQKLFQVYYSFLSTCKKTFINPPPLIQAWTKQLARQYKTRPCLLCLEPAHSRHGFCMGCENDLPWLHTACRRCAMPLPETEALTSQNICGECLTHPRHFDQCTAAWSYDFPLNALIPRFKYRQQRYLGRALSRAAMPVFCQSLLQAGSLPDALIPVPSHRRQLRARRFNQAEDIAHDISREFNIPLLQNAVLRSSQQHHQATLKRHERLTLLKHEFSLGTAPVAGKHIVVVDDVMTTGATANTIAQLLKKAGASRVDVWVLARTPKSPS